MAFKCGVPAVALLLMSALALTSLVQRASAQPIYKWVDAQGKTHYGSQPPADQTSAQPMQAGPKAKTASGVASGAASGAASGPASGAVPRAVAPKRSANELQELEQVDAQWVALDCSAAAARARVELGEMIEERSAEHRAGKMPADRFYSTVPRLMVVHSLLTQSHCNASTGSTRSFYQCMSNPKNHAMGCEKKHSFDRFG